MGLNSHAFNFLMCQAARAPLGRVLTIGRQSLDVDQKFLRSKLGKPVEPSAYCEPVLLALGATSVDSLDVSDYENARLRKAVAASKICSSEPPSTIVSKR